MYWSGPVLQCVPMPQCNLGLIALSESSSPSAGFTLGVMMHCVTALWRLKVDTSFPNLVGVDL